MFKKQKKIFKPLRWFLKMISDILSSDIKCRIEFAFFFFFWIYLNRMLYYLYLIRNITNLVFATPYVIFAFIQQKLRNHHGRILIPVTFPQWTIYITLKKVQYF